MTTVLVRRLSPNVYCYTGSKLQFAACASSDSFVRERILAICGALGSSIFGCVELPLTLKLPIRPLSWLPATDMRSLVSLLAKYRSWGGTSNPIAFSGTGVAYSYSSSGRAKRRLIGI